MSAPHSVAKALQTIRDRLTTLATTLHLSNPPQLIAVSKTKPPQLIQEAYLANQRHFGENYVVELCEKAPQLPADIRWHFIGHLQSNKAKVLARVQNLWMVESVDNEKLATALNKACQLAPLTQHTYPCAHVASCNVDCCVDAIADPMYGCCWRLH